MSFDDAFANDLLPVLYAKFGHAATVQRGTADPVPVTIIVDRGVASYGELEQIIGRNDQVKFMLAQWSPQKRDVVRWTDRYGDNVRTVAKLVSDDGLEAQVVISAT